MTKFFLRWNEMGHKLLVVIGDQNNNKRIVKMNVWGYTNNEFLQIHTPEFFPRYPFAIVAWTTALHVNEKINEPDM